MRMNKREGGRKKKTASIMILSKTFGRISSMLEMIYEKND